MARGSPLWGDVKGDAKVVIDAYGMAATPGFIDVHNHGDLSILYYPEAEGFVRQGITTFIGEDRLRRRSAMVAAVFGDGKLVLIGFRA